MSEKSLYKQYEEATAKYYGSDTDPLKFAPAVKDKDVAHELALHVERELSNIDEAQIMKDAVQARRNHKPMMKDPAEIEDYVRDDAQSRLNFRIKNAVVNTEITHARLAPEDFNEDQMQAGAYQQGVGIAIPKPRNPAE